MDALTPEQIAALQNADGKTFMIRFLPWHFDTDAECVERIGYVRKTRGYGYGSWEEFFATLAEARERFAALIAGRGIEDARLHESTGVGMMTRILDDYDAERALNERIEALGFTLGEMGGNCEAWIKDLGTGRYMEIYVEDLSKPATHDPEILVGTLDDAGFEDVPPDLRTFVATGDRSALENAIIALENER